jgi:hypothetical protein
MDNTKFLFVRPLKYFSGGLFFIVANLFCQVGKNKKPDIT